MDTNISVYLAELLEDTLDQFVDEMPTIYNIDSTITLVWPISLNQNTLFDAFSNNQEMKFYLDFIVDLFEKNYPNYSMDYSPCSGPVMWYRDPTEEIQASYIVFEWYEKQLQ